MLDMPADLPAREHAQIERTREFVSAHVVPGAAMRAQQGASSQSLISEAGEAGLLRMQVPLAMGGLGLRFSCKVQALEMIAAADFGVAMAVVNSHNVAEHLSRMAGEAVARRWMAPLMSGQASGCTALTEPSAGSDFASIRTRAEQVDGGWVLNGDKTWITNAVHADVVIVYAQTQPGAGAAGIAAFVVDAARPGFIRGPALPMGPVSSIGAGSFRLENYACDSGQMLASSGLAFKDIMQSINGARTYVAAMCCGMAGAALQLARDHGLGREAFGRHLHGHQGWRWRLADAAVDLDAARLLVARAAALIDSGLDAQLEAARAKVFATRMAQRHVAELMHAMGAQGLDSHEPLMRHLAAAQVAALVDGSTEMLLERIARDIRGA